MNRAETGNLETVLRNIIPYMDCTVESAYRRLSQRPEEYRIRLTQRGMSVIEDMIVTPLRNTAGQQDSTHLGDGTVQGNCIRSNDCECIIAFGEYLLESEGIDPFGLAQFTGRRHKSAPDTGTWNPFKSSDTARITEFICEWDAVAGKARGIAGDRPLEKETVSWDQIGRDYAALLEFSCVPDGITRLPDQFIMDKERPLQWNREQVRANNDEYYKEVSRLSEEFNQRRILILDSIYRKIQIETGHGLSLDNARKIWGFTWNRMCEDAGLPSSPKGTERMPRFSVVVKHLQKLIGLVREILSDSAEQKNPAEE